MNREEIIAELMRKFPKCIAIGITGSQRNNFIYNTISDIDVVIFDTCNCDLFSEMLLYDKIFKIDCTVLPVLNIENVINHELFDTKGTVLNMIRGATILFDPHLIFAEVIDIVKELDGISNNKIIRSLNGLRFELRRFKKYFDRNLEEHERILLISEFITILSKIAVIDATGLESDRLRKARLLKEEKPEMLAEIMGVFYRAIQSQELSFLNEYIEKFQQSQNLSSGDANNNTLIDLKIPDFSVFEFGLTILPELLKNEKIKQSFKYFYLSPKKYYRIYKNNVTLCFSMQPDDATFELLSDVIGSLPFKGESITYERVDLLNKFSSNDIENRIDELRIALSSFWIANIMEMQKHKYLKEDVCLKLNQFLLKLLDFDFEDEMYIGNWMLQRWLLSVSDQRNAGGELPILKKAKDKIEHLEKIFKTEYNRIERVYNTTDNIRGIFGHTIDILMYEKITSLLKDIVFLGNAMGSIKYFPESLFDFLKIKKSHEAKIYSILIEEIFQMLNLTDLSKIRVLYFNLKLATSKTFS